MGQLVRFKIGKDEFFTKARVILEHSRKQTCAVCGEKRWGVLVRHTKPVRRKDTLVCLECVVQISLGLTIPVGETGKFGHFDEKKIVLDAPIRAKKTLYNKPMGEKDRKCTVCDDERLFNQQGLMVHTFKKHPAEYDRLFPKADEGGPETEEEDGKL